MDEGILSAPGSLACGKPALSADGPERTSESPAAGVRGYSNPPPRIRAFRAVGPLRSRPQEVAERSQERSAEIRFWRRKRRCSAAKNDEAYPHRRLSPESSAPRAGFPRRPHIG